MLVLHPTSRCDVCLLEYTFESSARVPHAIACGHIFCRDCLYATVPPLCPLCRKSYLQTKIKKLHVDRPENVDEVRDLELGRQQLELLEQLVGVWELELKDGLDDDRTKEDTASSRAPNHEDLDHEVRGAVPSAPREPDTESLQLVRREAQDDEGMGVGDTGEGVNADFEQILDGIAGAPGVGRGFLERWGSALPNRPEGDGGVVVTLRDAQKLHAVEVLRSVDVWLETKEEETGVVLRKSRHLFSQHRAVRTALKDTLDFAKSLNDDRVSDIRELQQIREGMVIARGEIQKYITVVEELTAENQDLKARLSSTRSRTPNSPQPLRNPLPPPPEPVSTDHIPTFAQAVSETSGSPYSGSVYSPAGPTTHGVRFAIATPDSPRRTRERYGTSIEGSPNRPANGTPSSIWGRKEKARDTSHSYSYREDSGYFEDESRWDQPSFSSNAYPTSAPPAVQGFTPTQRPHGYASTGSNSQVVYNANTSYDQDRNNAGYAYSTRATAPQMRYENSSGPVDVYALTSAYLREYSAGFVNGQEAALGVGSFAPPPQQMTVPYSAPAGTSKAPKDEDNRDSIINTTESVEDDRRGRSRHSYRTSHSRSRSGPRALPSRISNPQLTAILSSPPRAQMTVVSLPSVSSHEHPSPSVSMSSNNQRSYSSSANVPTHEHDSPVPSEASSGLNPPPSLPQDPVAAAAMIAERLPVAHYAPSDHSHRTSQSWGTVYSNDQSNSLISGLRGLADNDNASVRTRGTRETRFSIDSSNHDRDSVRDSRRESHVSIGTRSVISEETRELSPARPVHTMVGVLPEVQDTDARRQIGTRTDTSVSMNRTGSNTNPNSYRSSTAVDRRIVSDSTVRTATPSTMSHGQSQRREVSQQSRQTEAQGIAARTGWTSAQNHNNNSATGYHSEYDRAVSSTSRHRDRHRDHGSSRRNREGRANRAEEDYGQARSSTHRSHTSMDTGGWGSSGWSWNGDSNAYPSISRSSHAHSRSHEHLSPTSHPSVVQRTSSNVPSSSRSSGDRDDRSNRSRTHHHGQSYGSTRPSLLGRDSSSNFPISVESTDDERYPGANARRLGTTASNTNEGRSTRIGNYTNVNALSTTVETNDSALQSFGTENALGLELITTANGINAPTPVSNSSAQGFLRSWSQGSGYS